MKKIMMAGLILMSAGNAGAAGGMTSGMKDSASLKCFHDARPMDGSFVSVELKYNGDSYDAIRTVIPSGFGGGDVSPRVTVLAKDLECNIQSVAAYCIGKVQVDGQSRNVSVEYQLVERTALYGLTSSLPKTPSRTVEIEVRSPLLKGEDEAKYVFDLDNHFGGCK